MAYVTSSDLQARLGTDAYLRLFDRDGNGTADSDMVADAIAHAEDVIDTMTRAAFGARFDLSGAPPRWIKDIAIDLAIGRAATAYPHAVPLDNTPYGALYQAALGRIRALIADQEARLAAGAPAPYAEGQTYVSSPTALFGAAAVSTEADADNGTNSGF